jgi:hypothetical protein
MPKLNDHDRQLLKDLEGRLEHEDPRVRSAAIWLLACNARSRSRCGRVCRPTKASTPQPPATQTKQPASLRSANISSPHPRSMPWPIPPVCSII